MYVRACWLSSFLYDRLRKNPWRKQGFLLGPNTSKLHSVEIICIGVGYIRAKNYAGFKFFLA